MTPPTTPSTVAPLREESDRPDVGLPAQSAAGQSADSAGRARVRLDPAHSPMRCVDGAWWPRSRDLSVEIPALLAALEPSIGPVERVSVHAGSWPEQPRRLIVDGRRISLGYFTVMDPSVLNLVRRGSDDIVLFVVPPAADQACAERAMARAADSADRSRPAEILAGMQPGETEAAGT